MKKIIIMLLCIMAANNIRAGKIDSLTIHDSAMNRDVKVTVVSPDSKKGKKARRYPVVYLLHGAYDNERSWLSKKPDLPEIADRQGIIFVTPNAGLSWYFDSPKKKDIRYESFVADSLVKYIDAHYSTIRSREGRAITGYSMGGHGALFIAMRHKDTFGAAGSTSGGVDIRPFPNNWGLPDVLGEFAANKKEWDEHTVVNQIDRIKDGDLAIIFDCGDSDFFLEANKDLHTRLLAREIGHDFITRPGGHDGNYWNNAIDYQLLFFTKFFNKQKPFDK